MLGVFHAVGVAVGDDNGGVVRQAVEDADGGGPVGLKITPLFEQVDQQLGAGVIERSKPEFVELS
ncbi:hypothetical protein H7K09_24595 [Mycolicibacterium duvalii]|uniref:Uncharacterized protein n=1 Tax=Mycolicibacterium duvalii TaxID=39688 RepID=A0A7I7K3E5_9MYCO|nr:hypothetical protein [Mycolicibacterium duvalii]BBX17989.1 hypothetical protein MDUV_28490 [Mycolicibacterium duvalii]